MDLLSGYPYFRVKHAPQDKFETLQSGARTDVLVLGGGISGALVAHALISSGISCIVADRRKIGDGSTAASTNLLQYEIDVPLYELTVKIGRSGAVRAYLESLRTIQLLHDISATIGHTGFRYCNSVLFSHKRRTGRHLKKEFESRAGAGLPVNYILADEIEQRYGIQSPEAIVSEKAAKIDAYLFTHQLHRYNMLRGLRVFEGLEIARVIEHKGGITAVGSNGLVIQAKNVVYATGYEATEQISRSLVRLHSTFALATQKIEQLPAVFEHTIFWNTDDPYLYFREDEGRLVMGGRDVKNASPAKRERLLEKRGDQVLADVQKILPALELKPALKWAGTFAVTTDGLPYIGKPSGGGHCYYALGYGGNGITFSALAAEYIAKSVLTGKNEVPEIYRFDR